MDASPFDHLGLSGSAPGWISILYRILYRIRPLTPALRDLGWMSGVEMRKVPVR